MLSCWTTGMGSAVTLSQPFLLPSRSQLRLAEVTMRSAWGRQSPCTLFLHVSSMYSTTRAIFCIMNFPLPSGFPLLRITEFTHLLKTVLKIQRKFDFPLVRFYGNYIFFFSKIFLSCFALENK